MEDDKLVLWLLYFLPEFETVKRKVGTTLVDIIVYRERRLVEWMRTGRATLRVRGVP